MNRVRKTGRRLLLGLAYIVSIAVIIAVLLSLVGEQLGRRLIFPAGTFDPASVPAEPDYSSPDQWAALPDRSDGADFVPPGIDTSDRQESPPVDLFYLHPTSYILGSNWNGDTGDRLARWIVDKGNLELQASAFNNIARIYAPLYRQASQGAQMQTDDLTSRQQALALAFSDVQRAFNHYLDHFNRDRPFIIASHSQGTTHAAELVKQLFRDRPADSQRLVVAYLVGNTVSENDLASFLPVCNSPDQTRCFVSWNAVREGGDGSHWRAKGAPVCVNPLSWKHDELPVAAEHNLGSIPLTGVRGIEAPQPKLTGARCGDGILWIDAIDQSGYQWALFPGGGYHAYDYNLFYMNIRDNAAARVEAWFKQEAVMESGASPWSPDADTLNY